MSTKPPPAIEVDALKKTYKGGLLGGRSIEALRGISFRVERGEIFALLGPNGAGKTTFIKILLGIVRKSGGAAQLLGHPAGDQRSRRQIGYLPENLRLPRHLTANTAMELCGSLSGMSAGAVKEKRGQLLELVGLSERAGDSVKKYSKGMLQRLGLAQSLLHDPDLLIYDEPTDGLDPVARAQVRSVLLDLKARGKTIFLNSHILQEVELVCDRVAILDRGELKYVGPAKDIDQHRHDGKPAPAGAAAAATASQPARTGFELDLELAGAEGVIREALKNRELKRWEPAPAGQFRLSLTLDDQRSVDGCIDDLRQRGVSIVGLARRKVSLEDAFLEILAEAAD